MERICEHNFFHLLPGGLWQTAIIKRRLKEGKTYEDFRKAWYHTVGFGTDNKMLTIINAADPREIIVVGLNETTVEQLRNLFDIDIKVRKASLLNDIIEPEIDRTIGILVAEDDFSATGAVSSTGLPWSMAKRPIWLP